MEPEEILAQVRKNLIENGQDCRYKPDAYLFVLNGLHFYLSKSGEHRHVTGQELSLGLLEFAHTQFGPLARNVLRHFGIEKTADFGHIVYNLIGIGIMGKQPQDRLEDFFDAAEFDEYFAAQENYAIDPDFIKRIIGA